MPKEDRVAHMDSLRGMNKVAMAAVQSAPEIESPKAPA